MTSSNNNDKRTKGGFFNDTKNLTLVSVLSAILILLTFTPLGLSVKVGVVEITFLCIPVAVGAIMLGPTAGAFLGGVFGVLSALTAITGYSAFGSILFSYHPVVSILLCIVPRVICGFVAGWIAILFRKIFSQANKDVAFGLSAGISGFVCSLLNTVLFCGGIIIAFGEHSFSEGLTMGNVLGTAALINGIPEAIACLILSGLICVALYKYLFRPRGKHRQ